MVQITPPGTRFLGPVTRTVVLWIVLLVYIIVDPRHLSYRLQQNFFQRSIDIFKGAPIRLGVFMRGNQFENIIAIFPFADILSQYFKNKLFEIFHMFVA